MLKKSIFVSVLSIFLTACGGGGGGGDTRSSSSPTTPPPSNTAPAPSESNSVLSISIDAGTLAMDDSDSVSFSFNIQYDGDKTLTVTASSTIDGVDIEVNDNILTVTTPDLTTFEETGTLTVTATDGDVSDSFSMRFNILNMSLYENMLAAKSLTSDLVEYYDQGIEAQNVVAYYLELTALLGDTAASDAQNQVTLLSSQIADKQLENRGEIRTIYNSLVSAENARNLTESRLDGWLTTIEDLHDEYVGVVSNSIEQARSASSDTLPAIPVIDVNVIGEKVSVFVGNTQLGQVSNDVFSFSPEYSFLEPLTSNNPAVCTTLIENEA